MKLRPENVDFIFDEVGINGDEENVFDEIGVKYDDLKDDDNKKFDPNKFLLKLKIIKPGLDGGQGEDIEAETTQILKVGG